MSFNVLRGHRGSVNTLDHSPKESTLLSGSDDGTARVWDLRSQRSELAIVVPSVDGSNEVTSVAFHPAGRDDAKTHDTTVYLSVGNRIYGYDLRNAKSPIIRECDICLSGIMENEDEINQIVFSGTGGNGKVRIAAADDCGDVRVSDAVPYKLSPGGKTSNDKRQKQRCQVLQHAKDGSAMATCAAFRPRCSGQDLVTGGTDCAIHLWDISRPRRPSYSVHISGDDTGASQVCNPPMVFDLSFSPSGKFLAAGLGDGTVSILGIKGRVLQEKCRLRDAHSRSVASVIYPSFGCDSSSHVAANDRLLVSGGSDGKLYLWDVGSSVAGSSAVEPSTWLVGCENGELDRNMASLSLDEKAEKKEDSEQPKILFGVPHGEKINNITSSTSHETALSSSVFVADTSFNITAYTFGRK